MTDELTTKQHSEFTISKETEIKHKCFSALERIHKYNYSIDEVLELIDVTKEQIQSYENEFLELLKND